MESSWKEVLSTEFDQSYFSELVDFIKSEYSSKPIFPQGNQIFRAFDAAPFERVSAALAQGKPAEDVEPDLQSAEDIMRNANDAAAGDPSEVIAFLLDTSLEEYKIGVRDGVVTDPGEYQDAWGFVQVAAEIAQAFGTESPEAIELQNEIQKLADLWPENINGETPPASVSDVASQISVVRLVLSGL